MYVCIHKLVSLYIHACLWIHVCVCIDIEPEEDVVSETHINKVCVHVCMYV